MKQLFLFLSLLAITTSQQLFAQESLWEVYHADSVELPTFRRPDQTDIDAQGYKWGVTSDGLAFTKSKDGITETIPVNDTSVGVLEEVLTVDFDNNIWAYRKDNSGFIKYTETSFLFIPKPDSYNGEIHSFIVSKEGTIYYMEDLNAYLSFIYIYNGSWTTKPLEWFGNHGHNRPDKKEFSLNKEEELIFPASDPFNPDAKILRVKKNGTFLIDTISESQTYWMSNVSHWEHRKGLAGLIKYLSEGRNTWFALKSHLAKYSDGNLIYFPYPYGIKNSELNAEIDIDINGDLWLQFPNDKVLKFRNEKLVVSGQTYFDSNQNGIKDPSESYLSNQKIKVLPSGKQFLTNQQGQFAFTGDSGATFVIEPVLDSGVNISSDSLRYTITLSDTNITGLDFGLYGSAFKAELSGSFSLPRFRCSTEGTGFLMFENGSEPLTDVSLKLQLPSRVEFIDADSLPDNHDGEIVWDLGDLAPFQTGKIKVLVKAPSFQQMGNSFAFKTSGMGYVGNTSIPFEKTNYYTLRCSYDPNDKQVSPEGVMDEGYTLKDIEEFDYLIRFQNTGNDTAYVVRLEDSLSTHLDWNSFEVADASHTYTTEIDENGLVTFSFDQIMLPDSTTNEPASNGYIRYQISPKAGLPDNTVIKNTAFIYFDYNPAVITNTTINTLVDELPKVTGTETSVETIGGFVFPNPTTEEINISSPEAGTIRLYSPTGNLRLKRNVEEGITKISLPELNKGLYLLELETGQGKQVSKLIIE